MHHRIQTLCLEKRDSLIDQIFIYSFVGFVFVFGLHGTAQAFSPVVVGFMTGQVDYQSCATEERDFLKDASRYGRIASVSDGFSGCITERVTNDYKKCPSDPFAEESRRKQIARVMAVSNAANGVKHVCTNASGPGNAWAGSIDYGHTETVDFSWGSWLNSVVAQLPKRVCESGESSREDDCRFAAYPWPYTQAAGIIWHEGMHTHSYDHGAADDLGKAGCGYGASSDYNMWENSMPYIVGQCINKSISDANNNCSRGVNSCPGENQLRMNNDDGSSCSCVNDPGRKGLGLLSLKDGELSDVAILPSGQRARGGWLYSNSNRVVGTGDFNGSGDTDLLIRSNWGLGILTIDSDGGWQTLALQANGRSIGGWRLDSRTNTFDGIGDFDGDGRDEIIIRSSWGIGVLELVGNRLSLVYAAPRNTWFGNWRWDAREVNGGRDVIAGIGDMNGDNRDDIVVKSPWGIGVLHLSGGRLRSLAMASRNTWLGRWRWDATVNRGRDVIESVADFNGDGRSEILVTSNWGIGIIAMRSQRFTAILAKPSGSSFRPWLYQSRGSSNPHRIAAIGDFDGNDAQDVLLQSSGALGLLTLSGDTFRTLSFATSGRRLGSWLLDTRRNSVAGAGDFDGDGNAEFLIRSNWGVGIISLNGNRLTSTDLVKHGLLAGSWRTSSSDRYRGIGTSNATATDRIIFQHRE